MTDTPPPPRGTATSCGRRRSRLLPPRRLPAVIAVVLVANLSSPIALRNDACRRPRPPTAAFAFALSPHAPPISHRWQRRLLARRPPSPSWPSSSAAATAHDHDLATRGIPLPTGSSPGRGGIVGGRRGVVTALTASATSDDDDVGGGGLPAGAAVAPASASDVDAEPASATTMSSPQQRQRQPPGWSRCLNGVTPKSSALNEAVAALCSSASNPPLDPPITLADANDLVDVGAVWARMDPLTEGEILAQYDDDDRSHDDGVGVEGGGGVAYYPKAGGSNANVRFGDLPRGWGGPSDPASPTPDPSGENEDDEDDDELIDDRSRLRYRRLLSPCVVPAGVDLRVYPNPRRFTEPCKSMTRENILHEDTTFLVVDKPPMLPTQPDASNYRECCPGCVADRLGPFYTIDGRRVGRPLLCHRVDSCVGGCVVLSKDARGQKVFSEFQRERKVKKLYLTVTTEPVPLGRHVHWMWAPAHSRSRSRRGSGGGGDVGPPCQLVSHTAPSSRRVAKDFWIRCVLEVTRSEPIDIAEDVIGGHSSDEPGGGATTRYYQSTIRLVTGRKHQVRAQLASLGCPIIRDTLYGPIAGMTLDRLGSDDAEAAEDEMDGAVSRCRVPTEPIGLHAHAILFGGIRARAGRPWWAADDGGQVGAGGIPPSR